MLPNLPPQINNINKTLYCVELHFLFSGERHSPHHHLQFLKYMDK